MMGDNAAEAGQHFDTYNRRILGSLSLAGAPWCARVFTGG